MMTFEEKYPEHAKLKHVQHKSQIVYDFLTRLLRSDIKLCKKVDNEYVPVSETLRELLGTHFDIDPVKLQQEKYDIERELMEMTAVRDMDIDFELPGEIKHLIIGQAAAADISEDLADVILKIYDTVPFVVFCGSLGLRLHGRHTGREIGDIDVVTNDIDSILKLTAEPVHGKSRKFEVGGKLLTCSGATMYGYEIDVFFIENEIKWEGMQFHGKTIRVQSLEEIMYYKEAIANGQIDDKHVSDLINLNNFSASAPDAVDDLPF